MSALVIPNVFSDTNVMVTADVNENFDAVETTINGLLDDTNIAAGADIDAAKLLNASILNAKLADTSISDAKMDYTSAKVLRMGPNISGNGLRMARGGKAFTNTNPAIGVSVTITFATDSDDGNPAFSATPRVTFGLEIASTHVTSIYITAKSASSITIFLSVPGGATISGTLHWHAMGAA